MLPLSLLMGLLLWLPAPAWAIGLPSFAPQTNSRRAAPAPLAPSAPSGRLQESAPPAAVQQLQQELVGFQPRIEIESPRTGTVLPAGPWELKLRVQDWPLVDGGTLGLGAHLVVQIDDQPPQRIAAASDGVSLIQSGEGNRDAKVVMQIPALAPGSHRVTAYASRPWGEAVKTPGSLSQIQLHRVAANPMALPTKGSPQLLAVSPADLSRGEPVLLDWLLLDAPLQNLRPGDGSWRLRVTINGDSFLVDQNVPLWLRGWRPGSNSLLLELVDGLGEPLNPPFNSLVRELDFNPGNGASSSRPRWLQGRLEPAELEVLLGRAEPTPEPDVQEHSETREADPALEPAETREAAEVSEPLEGSGNEEAPATAEPLDDVAADAAADTEPEMDPDSTETEAAASSVEPMPEPTSEPSQAESAAGFAAPTPERISSSTPLSGSAREQVNADGSLIKPKPKGPLAGLRDRIGGA